MHFVLGFVEIIHKTGIVAWAVDATPLPFIPSANVSSTQLTARGPFRSCRARSCQPAVPVLPRARDIRVSGPASELRCQRRRRPHRLARGTCTKTAHENLILNYQHKLSKSKVWDITISLQLSYTVTDWRLRFFGHIVHSSPIQDHHQAVSVQSRSRQQTGDDQQDILDIWLCAAESNLRPLNIGLSLAWRKAANWDTLLQSLN